jgi:lipopolysaccharide/colanic/teichoic acid biosynthesis glycosyltransferase
MHVLPTSRNAFCIRLTLFDSACAVVAPLLALYLREAPALSYAGLVSTLLYCSLSAVLSLIAFSAFSIHAGMTRYFSVIDAIDVTKAVTMASLTTYVALFTLTRLEGIPRTIPIIHALILLAGLTGSRILARLFEVRRTALVSCADVTGENILMIESNRLSLLYIKFIRAYSPGLHRIMAVLDDRPEMIGRAIDGVRVIGPLHHLEAVIHEFAEHGIRIDRVIVGGDRDIVGESALLEISKICDEHEIRLDFLPELVGLHTLQPAESRMKEEPKEAKHPRPAQASYFAYKRYLDLLLAVAILLIFLPAWFVIAAIALLDVGSPLFFWQQRLGQGGRLFLLHKIRTLSPPYDWRGRKVPDRERESPIGRFLRKCRFDEAPQLLNVLVGDMSLIGPRPLLLRDQPPDPTLRLSVRPGITGWAQVNGGKLLSVEEKTALDEWYVRNASLWLDLRIIYLTFLCVCRGERRSEIALDLARAKGSKERWHTPDEALVYAVPASSV